MKTLKTTRQRRGPRDPSTASTQAWCHATHRRVRRVFASLYGVAVLCLLWCALPVPNPLSAASLLPAIVAAQIVGAFALLGWLLAYPKDAAAPADEPASPLERWLVAVAHGASIEPTFGKQ